MVSFTSIATAVAAAFALASSPVVAQQEGLSIAAGSYYRPSGSVVSGVPGAKTPYRRSPCPAINTLANHGYLPRSGQGITRQGLKDAVMKYFNLDDGLATFVTSLVPETFDLDLLGKHGFIEHDASLVHRDAYFGGDPSRIDPILLADFLYRGVESQEFTVQTLGEIRRDRFELSQQINPNFTFDGQASFLAFGEATFVVTLFGGPSNETASYSNVKSFLKDEKFPAGYKKPSVALSQAALTAVSAKIQAVASATA